MAAAAASFELELALPFGLGEKEAAVTLDGYNDLTFTVFSKGYNPGLILILVLVHQYLYQQGLGGPVGNATVGWWQEREGSRVRSGEGIIWDGIQIEIEITTELRYVFQRIFF